MIIFSKCSRCTIIFNTPLICCCSPLSVPVVRGEGDHGYCHLFFVFSFLLSLFSRYVLYHQSPTPSIFCYCSPFSSHSFQISLSPVLPLHSWPSSPPFQSTFWAICSLFQFFYTYSFHMSSPFQPTLHHFLLKPFLHSNLHSQSIHSSFICSLHSHISSHPVVFTNLHFLLFLLNVQHIQSKLFITFYRLTNVTNGQCVITFSTLWHTLQALNVCDHTLDTLTHTTIISTHYLTRFNKI